MSLRLNLLLLTTLLVGCDLNDIPGLGPDPRVAQRDADSKAIGGACRYGLRGIEDCYTLNPKASKAQIFAGWKDMDQYMRDNKIDGVASSLPVATPEAAADKPAEAKEGAQASAKESPELKKEPTNDAKMAAGSKAKAKAELKDKPEAKSKAKAEMAQAAKG